MPVDGRSAEPIRAVRPLGAPRAPLRRAALVPTRTLVLAEGLAVVLGVSLALVRFNVIGPAETLVGVLAVPGLIVLMGWIVRDLDRHPQGEPEHRAAILALGLLGLSLALLLAFTQAIGIPLPWEPRRS